MRNSHNLADGYPINIIIIIYFYDRVFDMLTPQKSVVPDSSHDKGGFFYIVFADSKPTLSNDRSTRRKGFRCQPVKYPVTKLYIVIIILLLLSKM